jgi:hypothetical protein
VHSGSFLQQMGSQIIREYYIIFYRAATLLI